MDPEDISKVLWNIWRDEGFMLMSEVEYKTKTPDPILPREEVFDLVLDFAKAKNILPEETLLALARGGALRREVLNQTFPANHYGK